MLAWRACSCNPTPQRSVTSMTVTHLHQDRRCDPQRTARRRCNRSIAESSHKPQRPVACGTNALPAEATTTLNILKGDNRIRNSAMRFAFRHRMPSLKVCGGTRYAVLLGAASCSLGLAHEAAGGVGLELCTGGGCLGGGNLVARRQGCSFRMRLLLPLVPPKGHRHNRRRHEHQGIDTLETARTDGVRLFASCISLPACVCMYVPATLRMRRQTVKRTSGLAMTSAAAQAAPSECPISTRPGSLKANSLR